MHRAVIDLDRTAFAAPAFEPGRGVLHPLFVVPLGEILMRVGAAAFLAVVGAVDGDAGLADEVIELQRFDQIGVPDQRAVADLDVVHPFIGLGERGLAL